MSTFKVTKKELQHIYKVWGQSTAPIPTLKRTTYVVWPKSDFTIVKYFSARISKVKEQWPSGATTFSYLIEYAHPNRVFEESAS